MGSRGVDNRIPVEPEIDFPPNIYRGNDANLIAKRPEGAMFEAGFNVAGEIARDMREIARLPAPNSRYSWKSLAVATSVFMLAFLAPVSVDIIAGEVSVTAAQAGNGDGNYGNGGGNGGPNGQLPGNRGNDGKPGDGDDPADDDGPANDDNPTEGDGSNYVPEEPGAGAGADESSDMADADSGDAIEAATGSPDEGPMAGAPAAAMPTVSQIFSLGDEAVVSGDAELELIANGWKTTN